MTTTGKLSDDMNQTGEASVGRIVAPYQQVGGKSNNQLSVLHAGE